MAKVKDSKNPMSPTTVKRMYKNRVALPDDVKEKVCDICNVKLAAALDTYTQAKYAHWPEHVEALANAVGSYCKELREASDDIDELKDEPTSDFFKQLVVEAEEELYFLESHLEAGPNVQ